MTDNEDIFEIIKETRPERPFVDNEDWYDWLINEVEKLRSDVNRLRNDREVLNKQIHGVLIVGGNKAMEAQDD